MIQYSKNDFLELIQYISTNDITNSAVYDIVSNWIDVEEYIKYQIIQIFVDIFPPLCRPRERSKSFARS